MPNYFVDKENPDASDSNTGVEAEPFLTIQHAADILLPGDTAFIKQGGQSGYEEHVMVLRSGLPGQPLTFKAFPGHEVWIDGAALPFAWGSGLFFINGRDARRGHIRVEDLGARHAYGHPFACGLLSIGPETGLLRNEDISFLRCRTYDTQSCGIGNFRTNKVLVDECDVDHAQNSVERDHESLTLEQVDDFQLSNTHVHHSSLLGPGGAGMDMKNGCSRGKCFFNYIHNIGAPGIQYSAGIYMDAWEQFQHDIDVFSNLVHDVAFGVEVGSERGGPVENIGVYNNIVYNAYQYWAFVVSAGRAVSAIMRNVRIINNTAYGNGDFAENWGGGVAVWNELVEGCIVRNNICSENFFQMQIGSPPGVIEPWRIQADHNLLYGPGRYDPVYGSDYIEGDPLFVDPENGDFHLREGSPAIRAGSPDGAPAYDFDGKRRPRIPDLGAYQRSPAGKKGVILPVTVAVVLIGAVAVAAARGKGRK